MDSGTGVTKWRMPDSYFYYQEMPALLNLNFVPAIGPDGTVYVSRRYGGDSDPSSFLFAIEGDSPIAKGGWPTYRGNQQRTGQWWRVLPSHSRSKLPFLRKA